MPTKNNKQEQDLKANNHRGNQIALLRETIKHYAQKFWRKISLELRREEVTTLLKKIDLEKKESYQDDDDKALKAQEQQILAMMQDPRLSEQQKIQMLREMLEDLTKEILSLQKDIQDLASHLGFACNLKDKINEGASLEELKAATREYQKGFPPGSKGYEDIERLINSESREAFEACLNKGVDSWKEDIQEINLEIRKLSDKYKFILENSDDNFKININLLAYDYEKDTDFLNKKTTKLLKKYSEHSSKPLYALDMQDTLNPSLYVNQYASLGEVESNHSRHSEDARSAVLASNPYTKTVMFSVGAQQKPHSSVQNDASSTPKVRG